MRLKVSFRVKICLTFEHWQMFRSEHLPFMHWQLLGTLTLKWIIWNSFPLNLFMCSIYLISFHLHLISYVSKLGFGLLILHSRPKTITNFMKNKHIKGVNIKYLTLLTSSKLGCTKLNAWFFFYTNDKNKNDKSLGRTRQYLISWWFVVYLRRPDNNCGTKTYWFKVVENVHPE